MGQQLPQSQLAQCRSFAANTSVFIVTDSAAPWSSVAADLIGIGCHVEHRRTVVGVTSAIEIQKRRTLVLIDDPLQDEMTTPCWDLLARGATLCCSSLMNPQLQQLASLSFDGLARFLWLVPALWLRYPLTYRARYDFARLQFGRYTNYRELVSHLSFCCPTSAAEAAQRLNVSTRTLHRMMSVFGTTFHSFSRMLLREVAHSVRTSDQVKLSTLAQELGCQTGAELSRRLNTRDHW